MHLHTSIEIEVIRTRDTAPVSATVEFRPASPEDGGVEIESVVIDIAGHGPCEVRPILNSKAIDQLERECRAALAFESEQSLLSRALSRREEAA